MRPANTFDTIELSNSRVVNKGSNRWFDKIIWLPEEPAELMSN